MVLLADTVYECYFLFGSVFYVQQMIKDRTASMSMKYMVSESFDFIKPVPAISTKVFQVAYSFAIPL